MVKAHRPSLLACTWLAALRAIDSAGKWPSRARVVIAAFPRKCRAGRQLLGPTATIFFGCQWASFPTLALVVLAVHCLDSAFGTTMGRHRPCLGSGSSDPLRLRSSSPAQGHSIPRTAPRQRCSVLLDVCAPNSGRKITRYGRPRGKPWRSILCLDLCGACAASVGNL